MLTLELQEKYIQRPKDVKVIIIKIIIIIIIFSPRPGNNGLMSIGG